MSVSEAAASVTTEATAPAVPQIQFDAVTQSLAPSHILQDGRFIHLPPPTDRERRHFFERSIARHGLLEEDLGRKKQSLEEEEKEKKEEKKVHPLALASARLQADGINELNRAINLSALVASREYFGMTNIVDPALEIPASTGGSAAAAASSSTEAAKSGETGNAGNKAPAVDASAAAKSESAVELQEEQRVKAAFILKRKRSQFRKANAVLSRHRRRLAAAIVTQSRPDSRLRQLRPQWRLVAPEHGTRALPHAARPTEVVACDVEVYLKSGAVLGRLTSRVPRYATMELKEEYSVQADLKRWNERVLSNTLSRDSDAMEVDEEESTPSKEKREGKDSKSNDVWTIAEPFAIADPTLGRLDDFDPKKVPMLSLQFDIEKASTGFHQSAVLEAVSSFSEELSNGQPSYQEDEKVLFALQQSLFCAKLFESIRRELAPDTEEVGNVRTTAKVQSVVWLSGENEENFLPASSFLSGTRTGGLAPLCVVHCHEGEVKVQLDCEYTLRVKLVEACANESTNGGSGINRNNSDVSAPSSGSQSPEQLLALCRTLLLHAQERYHIHSARAAVRLREQEEEESTKQNYHSVIRRKETVLSPRILQSCVSLGAKMLFERRIRAALRRVNEWLQQIMHTQERLNIVWLSLSVFDLHAQCTITFRAWVADVHLVSEELTVSTTNDDGDFRKVKFHSDVQFELYLKLALERLFRETA